MTLLRSLLALIACSAVTAALAVAQPPGQALSTARGEVGRVGRDMLVVKPRLADGRFGKDVSLRVTGTSRVSVVTMQRRGGRLVPVQQDTELKELKPRQAIAVIYAEGPAGAVLLTAVALPAPGR